MLSVNELAAEIDIVRNHLLEAIVQSKDRAELGKRNVEQVKTLDQEIGHYEFKKNDLTNAVNYGVKICKNIEHYLSERKETSEEILKEAVQAAGYIVPDSDVEGIHLSIYDKTAKIVNGLGQDVNLREGSAFRTIIGMLLRYVCIKQQPNKIQTIFLDEAFSTLSDVTTSTWRDYLEAFRQDTCIVGIEQHDTLFSGVEKRVYEFTKNEDKTTIIRLLED